MALRPAHVLIYHITDVANLPDILNDGGLHSDAVMAQRNATVIGYSHIKERRLTQIRVPCCNNRFVGEFVPFYFCPRSPMLYTINQGNTGRPQGCQATIIHLVSNVAAAISLGQVWAISDGNAGAYYTDFDSHLNALDGLDWPAIRARNWQGKTHEKSAEFLLADFFPWNCIQQIGCHNSQVAQQVKVLIQNHSHQPSVDVEPSWYY
jgi:ssDNA thymidine ADP-ribosyltransferase, DarT